MSNGKPAEKAGGDDKSINEIIAEAEAYAKLWLMDIRQRKAHAEINGHGVDKIYELTNKLRNAEASKQAMRLITNEVRRLHNVADEANQAQTEFAKETIVSQREFTRALVEFNRALVDLAARVLKIEEHQVEIIHKIEEDRI